MQVDHDLVLRVARLAKLDLSESEIPVLQERLNRILDYVRILDELEGEASEFRPAPSAALRPDAVQPSLSPEVIRTLAPASRDDFFQVPKIME